MGAAASSDIAARIAGASEEDMQAAILELSASDRAKLKAAAAEPPMMVEPKLTELLDEAVGITLLVALPPAYDSGPKSDDFNVVYILDEGDKALSMFAAAAQAAHAALKGKEGRQWHPELICVGVKEYPAAARGNVEQIAMYVSNRLPALIDHTYRTKPYGAARALCSSRAGAGNALVRAVLSSEQHALAKLFRFFLLGDAADITSDAAVVTAAGDSSEIAVTLMPEKTQVFLCCSALGPQHETAARAMQAALLARTRSESTETTLFVNREGEQTYTESQKKQGPTPVTLEMVKAGTAAAAAPSTAENATEGEALAVAFAQRGARWMSERFEFTKLESLGALMPWHEFK